MTASRRWTAYLAAAFIGALVLLTALAGTAHADEHQPIDPSDPTTYAPIQLGQTPAGLAWIDLKDSHGIPLWNLEMSLNRDELFNPAQTFWAVMVDQSWGLYRSFCALALWFIDWVMALEWMHFIAAPLLLVGDAMQSVLNSIGLVPTFLSLTVLLAGIWMIRGKNTTAVYEVLVACIIAALAAGMFAQPVRMVAGPDGLIVKAAETGQVLSSLLVTGGDQEMTAEQLRQQQTAKLVDVFIRQPTQMINFGRVIDGTTCETAYNDVVKDGPYGNEPDIRDAVADCDEALGEYAANPSAPMAIGSFIYWPASLVMLLLAALLGGAVIVAGIRGIVESMKGIVTLITGLLPGGGRGSLLLTIAEIIVSMLVIIFTSIFLSIFLLVVETLFTTEAGGSPQGFIIADITIIAGLFVYWRYHKRLTALSYRMAEWMARRPGGNRRGVQPTRLPERQPGLTLPTVASIAHVVTDLARARRERQAAPAPVMGPTYVDNRSILFGGGPWPGGGEGGGGGVIDGGVVHPRPPGGGGPGGGGGGGGVVDVGEIPNRPSDGGGSGAGGSRGTPGLPSGGGGQLPPGPETPGLPPGRPGAPHLPAGPSAGRRRIESVGKKAAGMLARAGTNAALAYATGGSSAVLSGAAKAAGALRTARRAALGARMVTGDGKSSPRRRPPKVAGQPRRRPDRPAHPAASAGLGKGTPQGAGKGAGRSGKAAQVTVMRPGDPGYLTPRERLAGRQMPAARATSTRENKARQAEELRRQLAEKSAGRRQNGGNS